MMKPSKYQLAILDWLENGNGNATCNAVAGAGKSTTLKLAAQQLEQQGISPNEVKIIVFGKQNSLDLIAKFGQQWKESIKTLHSAGFKILQGEIGRFRRDERVRTGKYRAIAEDLEYLGKKRSKDKGRLIAQKVIEKPDPFLTLIDLVRLTLSDTGLDSLSKIVSHYNLEGIYNLERVSQAIARILRVGEEQALDHQIDYTDMIWLPVKWELNKRKWFTVYRFVLADECQDLNAAQLELSLMLAGEQGRLLYVGDPRQAIFGFAGADNRSYYKIRERTKAAELPLSICYRCPRSHIKLVNHIFPDIAIEPREDAPEGRLEAIEQADLWAENKDSHLKVGDMVISRKTAPLVSLCIRLIGKGIAATVKGKDIGQQIKSDLEAIAEISGFTYREFHKYADLYRAFKFQTYEGRDNEEQLKENLNDKLEALKTIYSSHPSVTSVEELCHYIDDLFSDEESPVTLSTCHRAKGLEGERIFIIKPDDMPMTWKNQLAWQSEQEDNLLYVALTRSKFDLFIVGNPDWLDIDKNQPETSETPEKQSEELSPPPELPFDQTIYEPDEDNPEDDLQETEKSLQLTDFEDIKQALVQLKFDDKCKLLTFLEDLVTQEKWDRVIEALEENAIRSDRVIATSTNTSAPFVAKVRQTMIEQKVLEPEDSRIDKRGRRHKSPTPLGRAAH